VNATELIIIGAGGGVADIADLVLRAQRNGIAVELAGLLDDNVPDESIVYGHRVVGRLADWTRFDNALFVSTIRNEAVHHRHEAIIAPLGIPRERWATLTDSAATVAAAATVGPGSYVCAGAVVAPGVAIGDHVSVGPNSTIGHDCVLDDFVVVAPAAVIGGRVTIERAAYIGSGASVTPEVRVGARSLVGLGSVVVGDVSKDHVVVGNPARTIRVRSAHSS